MIKSFKVKITDHPDELLIKAKQLAEENGFQLLGDSHKGTIQGAGTEAQYILHDKALTINILRKPMLLSWNQVEKKVRDIVTLNRQGISESQEK